MKPKRTPSYIQLPPRKYCDGGRKMVSMRLPERLWAELEKVAEGDGWSTSDVVLTALDQYLQWANRGRKTK